MLKCCTFPLFTLWSISGRCLVLPRSEHWITRRWHWHLNGHLGPSGMEGRPKSVVVSGRPDPASSSIMKSRKPDWRKGRAQQAVTRSRERQADLMVLLAGSLEDERTQFKGFGWIHFQNSLSIISFETTILCWTVSDSPLYSEGKSAKRRAKTNFQCGSESEVETRTQCGKDRTRDIDWSPEGQRAKVKGGGLQG